MDNHNQVNTEQSGHKHSKNKFDKSSNDATLRSHLRRSFDPSQVSRPHSSHKFSNTGIQKHTSANIEELKKVSQYQTIDHSGTANQAAVDN